MKGEENLTFRRNTIFRIRDGFIEGHEPQLELRRGDRKKTLIVLDFVGVADIIEKFAQSFLKVIRRSESNFLIICECHANHRKRTRRGEARTVPLRAQTDVVRRIVYQVSEKPSSGYDEARNGVLFRSGLGSGDRH